MRHHPTTPIPPPPPPPWAPRQDYFYSKPWTRGPAYLCGVAAALWYLHAAAAAAAAAAGHGDGGAAAVAPAHAAVTVVPASLDAAASDPAPPYPQPLPGSAAGVPSRKREAWRAAIVATVLAGLGVLFWVPIKSYGGGGWSDASLFAFTALSRAAWGTGLSVLIIACLQGWWSAKPIAAFLGLPAWEPLARLTFGTYLLHPIVMVTLYGTATTIPAYSPLGLAASHAAMSVFAWCCGGCMYLGVETVVAAAEKAVVGGGSGGGDA
jgi:hypothetical protein